MPNLRTLISLKNKYLVSSSSGLNKEKTKELLESFDPDRIKKGFESEKIKTKLFTFNDDFKDKYADYFIRRKKVNAVLLFIDVTSFSTKFLSKTAEEVANFLDEYYDKVIPLIIKHGGEVEKIMGDGIICVFGEPFLTFGKKDLHRDAEKSAIEIINTLKGTDFEVKIAFHYGEIMYYQNDSIDYAEYTMIGNALTELFRLESISLSNSINFYADTYYDRLNQEDVATNKATKPATWHLSKPQNIKLRGVSYEQVRHLKKL